MITNSKIMWTCLPNGVVTTSTGAVASPLTFKMSVVVTPQLVSNAAGDTISGTVFQNWPLYVEAVTAAGNWIVAFDNAQTEANATMTNHITKSPAFNVDGSSLWQAIFPATTPVSTTQTSASPVADYTIHSYDAGQIATAIRAAHRYAVQSHIQHGRLVLTGSDPYSVLLEERKTARRVLPKMAAALHGVPRGAAHSVLRQAYHAETGGVGIGYELMRHALFYDLDKHRAKLRESSIRPDITGDDAGTSPALASDFNTLLAHLGGQPQLLRKLGLIIDLQFTPPPAVAAYINSLPAGTTTPPNGWKIYMSTPPPSTYASALASVSLSNVTNVEPVTYADITGSLFRTTVLGAPSASAGGSINNGFLPLGDSAQYTVYTEDTEGSPIKLDVTTGAAPTNPAPGGADLSSPFPALRTSGVAVSQTARDSTLETTFAKQTQLTEQYWLSKGNVANEILYAEDVVRGYAVDIQVTNTAGVTTPFQSICLRDTRAFFPGLSAVTGVPAGTPASFVISDEGYTKASAANAPGGGTELDLHSALFGWEGWSLGAQRPGRAITAATPPGDIVQTETPLQPVNTPANNFPNCQFTVRARAGSLPRLRFGYKYAFRARVLDLAGNDMSLPSATAGLNVQPIATTANPIPSGPVTYLRYEPVPNPVLVLQAPLTEGEHVENLVIRSNPWGATAMSASDYATASVALNPMNAYQANCARWVAPPKGSWAQAEAMGAFDANYFNPMSAAVAADIKAGALVAGAAYSDATFLAAKNALFQCSQKEAGLFTDALIWDTSNTTATSPSAQNPVQIVTPPTAQNLPAPTNPGQPLAAGQYNILLNNGKPVHLPYLPDANAQGIAIQQLDANNNVVGTATRTYAPRLSGGSWPEIDMPQFELMDGGVGGAGPSLKGTQTANPAGLDGSSPKSNAAIVFSLAPGQQYSFKYGSVVANVNKMASSDINPSSQNNALETIPTYAPYRTISMVHAVQQPKPPAALSVTVAPRNAGDTSITITGGFSVDGLTSQSADFTASWVEPVDVELSANVLQAIDGTNRRSTVKQGRVQSWTLGTSDAAVSFTSLNGAAAPPLVQQFGDTKTRLVSFQATATSRFREYFPASLQANAFNFQNSVPAGVFTEGELASSGTRIPSTARPTAPRILYVVPTYAWTTVTKASAHSTTSTRAGRGLRVFVDRPWYTSGDTEQLAVLVNPEGTSAPALAGYVSQWGMDPTRNSQADALAPLDQNQLPSGILTPSVPLAELPNESVTILAFNPSAYDPVRQLWYFDIEFGANAVEAPFVRLALARYQANSLGGPAFPNSQSGDLRMSTVVLADMVKLSADRTGTYIVNADSSVSVTLAGHVYADGQWSGSAGALTATTANGAAADGRMVFAQVLESTATNPGEFDWYPVGAAVNLTPYQLAGAPGNSTALSFMGSVPKATLVAGTKHQLLITEHEVFVTDTAAAFPGAMTPPPKNYPQGAMPLHPPMSVPPPSPTTSRVVFSDVLALPY